MRWLAFALVLASCTGSPVPSPTSPTATPTERAISTPTSPATPSPSPTPSAAEHVDRDFGVRFTYPPEWSFVPGYGAPRYEGATGFVMLDAALAPTVTEACRNAAEHVLEPYGSKPRVEKLTVDGREACVVLPSEDQPIQRFRSAALAVLAPRLVRGQYPVLVVYADLDHVMEIARSLRFLTR